MSDPVDVLVLPRSEDANILARANVAILCSQTPKSIYPLSRLVDDRPSQRFIFPTALDDDWIQFQVQEVPNGTLDSWGGTPNRPDSFTVTETGAGTVTEETVTVISGSALNLSSGGAAPANNAQAAIVVPIVSDSKYELRASMRTSNAADPATLEVFNPNTGKYLTPGGTWSKTKQNVFEETSTASYVENVLQFETEGFDETRRHSMGLRIRAHMDGVSASRTYLFENIFLIPAFNFASVHSHNIEERIIPRISVSDSDVSALMVDSLVNFPGNVHLVRSSELPGLIDSRRGTVSFWIRAGSGTDGTELGILSNLGNFFFVRRTTGNAIQIIGFDSGAVTALNMTSSATLTDDGNLHHVFIAYDVTLGVAKMRFDGVDVSGAPTISDRDIDYTRGEWRVGSMASGASVINGDLAELWFYPGIYVDPDDPAELAKFYSATGFAAILGANGEIPIGSPPYIYLNNAAASFGVNDGFADGSGDFTPTGAGTITDVIELLHEMTVSDPTFYSKASTETFARYIRFHFAGVQDDEIEIGQLVAGIPIALLRNPTQNQVVDEETLPLRVLATEVANERWTTKHSKQKQRGKTLRFQHRDAHMKRLGDLIWDRTDFGAYASVLVPDTSEEIVIHGQVERNIKTISRRSLDLVVTDLTFIENPHGITLE